MPNKNTFTHRAALVGVRLGPVAASNLAPNSSVDASQHRLMFSIPEACFMLGIGRTSVYGLIKRGKLKSVKLGSRTLIPTEDILRFAAELAGAR